MEETYALYGLELRTWELGLLGTRYFYLLYFITNTVFDCL